MDVVRLIVGKSIINKPSAEILEKGLNNRLKSAIIYQGRALNSTSGDCFQAIRELVKTKDKEVANQFVKALLNAGMAKNIVRSNLLYTFGHYTTSVDRELNGTFAQALNKLR